MCGISGIFEHIHNREVDLSVLEAMTEKLQHRGPDAQGLHLDGRIGLGHQRLSIIDIAAGHQPMASDDGAVWITFNGEIFNFREIRSELKKHGHVFKTNSDTEVLVKCYCQYGEECLSHLVGQFAFAIWDGHKQILFLARDRLGQKPLHYSYIGERFVFASELKALHSLPDFPRAIDHIAVGQSLLCSAFIGERTMYKDVHELRPGHYMVVSAEAPCPDQKPYWDLPIGKELPKQAVDGDVIEQFTQHLKTAVETRLISEVPLGCFLSGGLDSTATTYLAAKAHPGQLSTYTLEYARQFDKSDTTNSMMVAEAINALPHLVRVSEDDYYQAMHKVAWHLERPFELGAASLFLLYEEAKKSSTVIITGEGADEFLGGYFNTPGLDLGNAIQSGKAGPMLPWVPYYNTILSLLSQEYLRESRVEEETSASLQRYCAQVPSGDTKQRLFYLFQKIFLVELLRSHDRLGLASSVESRAPFVDHRLVEWLWMLPYEWKVSGNVEKRILREAISRFPGIPNSIAHQKKKPIPSPKGESLRRQLALSLAMLKDSNSSLALYFDKKKTSDFLSMKNGYSKADPLELLRISHTLIALELTIRCFSKKSECPAFSQPDSKAARTDS